MKLTRTYYYESDFSPDVVKHKLEQYFKMTLLSYNRNHRFSGFFISDTEFEVRSKWQLTFFRKPFKKPAYVSGKLLQPGHGRLRVNLLFRYGTLLSPVFLGIWFIFPQVIYFFVGKNWSASTHLTVASLTLLFQVSGLTLAFYVTNRVEKKRIERLLRLRKINFQ